MTPAWATPQQGGVLVRVKAVPGSSRNLVRGPLGDHLKVLVSAPPEGGKANAAIVELLAGLFEVEKSSVSLRSGASSPRKVFSILGVTESVFVGPGLSALPPGG